jgi:single-strand DNA-binding protein
MGINVVVLMGRLTKEPEIRSTTSGKSVASFTLAVDRNRDEADFINISAWDKTAELVQQYCHKGSQVTLIGRIQVRSYDAKDGSRRYVTDIVASNVQFCGSRKDAQENNLNSLAAIPGVQFTDIEADDGDLPF